MKEEWKKVLREYCYKNNVDYPYSAEEDLGYHPGSDPVPSPGMGGGGYAPGGYAPGGYGPAPGGYAPAPTYYAPGPNIYPASGHEGVPAPYIATPAADFSNPDVPPPKDPYNGEGAKDFKPSKGYPSSGYSLPPPPSDLSLPKYSYDGDTKDDMPAQKPAEKKKPAESKKPVDDDSDDEDLMARLRNLQK